jgi:hypothetical protein
MPTFREFLTENNIPYSFKTIEHLKEIPHSSQLTGQPKLEPKDIGDAINDTVAATLSPLGMSGTAEDLRDHVNTAVEEVQDVIDGQVKKTKFVVAAAEFKKTVDKLKSKGKKRKNVLMVKKLIKTLGKLDNVIEHEKNNPAQKEIGDSILSDRENTEHIIATATEALNEKKASESWGSWLMTFFQKLWGGVKAIWNFIRSNIKIIAGVIMIIWVVYTSFTAGGLSAGLEVMSEQITSIATAAWQACQGIFDFGYTWLIKNPTWFVKSAFGTTDELAFYLEKQAVLKANERRIWLGGGWLSATTGAVGAVALNMFGISTGGSGYLVVAAASGVLGGVVTGYDDAVDARYRQDLLYDQQLQNAVILFSIVSTIVGTRFFRSQIKKAFKKILGVDDAKAEEYMRKTGSLVNLGMDAYKTNIKYNRKMNRMILNSYQRIASATAKKVGFEDLARAVEYDMNESALRLDGNFNRWREKFMGSGDFEAQWRKDVKDLDKDIKKEDIKKLKELKVAEQKSKKETKKNSQELYVKSVLSRLQKNLDNGIEFTEENVNKFMSMLEKENKDAAKENLFADEESDGELSDTPTEEMSPLDRLVPYSNIRLRF